MSLRVTETLHLRLTGWKAGVALAVFVGLVGFRALGSRTVTEEPILAALRQELALDRSREALLGLESAMARGDDDAASGVALDLTGNDLELLEVRASKPVIPFLGKDELILRVRHRAGDGQELTTYYSARRHGLGTWRIGAEVGALWYYLDLV